MSWLSKATGIHIGGNWGVSKSLNKGWDAVGRFIAPGFTGSALDRARSLVQGDVKGTISGVTKQQIAADTASQEQAARIAAHDAEVASLAKDALGSLALRRRRGAGATMLTGTPGMMGGSPTSTGKTLLSQ